jgi:cytoskeleton protein RodZ
VNTEPIEPAAADIGAGLRQAREAAGLTLRQIADETKLSVRMLEALERNRITQLPGGIYRRNVVRSYASEIGLDPEETLGTFLARYPDDLPPLRGASLHSAAVREPAGPPRNSRRAGVIGALIPILAGVAYLTFNAWGR